MAPLRLKSVSARGVGPRKVKLLGDAPARKFSKLFLLVSTILILFVGSYIGSALSGLALADCAIVTKEDKEIFSIAGITIGAALDDLVGVGVGVAADVGVTVGFGEGATDGIGAGVPVGVGDQIRQTFFLPSFLQTNLLFGVSKNAPTLLQVLPTLGTTALA